MPGTRVKIRESVIDSLLKIQADVGLSGLPDAIAFVVHQYENRGLFANPVSPSSIPPSGPKPKPGPMTI